MAYTDPEEISSRLVALIERLQSSGSPDAAAVLQRTRETAYSTGSEWRGELGQAIREVERRFNLGPDSEDDLRWLMARVHEVWPSM